jgi:hypothetical protein
MTEYFLVVAAASACALERLRAIRLAFPLDKATVHTSTYDILGYILKPRPPVDGPN